MFRCVIVAFAVAVAYVAARPAVIEGPYHDVFDSLTDGQRLQLNQTLFDKSLTKGQKKQRINDFVATLPAASQEMAKKNQEQMERLTQEIEQKVNGLSGDAQALFNQLKASRRFRVISAIHDDDTITSQQEVDKMTAIADLPANKAAIKELQSIGLPLSDTDA